MGILLISLTVIIWSICIYRVIKIDTVHVINKYGLIMILIPSLLMLSVNLLPTAPPSYHYQAGVIIHDKEEIICFEYFEQSGDRVIIDEYCVVDICHLMDFKCYTLIEKPITIYLVDNENSFIYQDRITGEKHGSVEGIARQ
jgi:hypothetical protein